MVAATKHGHPNLGAAAAHLKPSLQHLLMCQRPRMQLGKLQIQGLMWQVRAHKLRQVKAKDATHSAQQGRYLPAPVLQASFADHLWGQRPCPVRIAAQMVSLACAIS